MAAIRTLDLRDDLKSGWSVKGSAERHLHWAFTDSDAVRDASTLAEYLAAFRFAPVIDPDGDLIGVGLEGGTRSAGDEQHLWTALAPYVRRGGELIWVGEDEVFTSGPSTVNG